MSFGKQPALALGMLLIFATEIPAFSSDELLKTKTIKVETAGDPGTAFIIGPSINNNTCLLVTAYHVIDVNSPSEPLVFILPRSGGGKKPITFTLSKSSFIKAGNSLDLAFTPVSSCQNSLNISLARASSVAVSTKVTVMGYPFDQAESLAKNPNPFKVSGRVTQFGDADELGYDISYDAATKPGYSGGPVFTEDGSEIIAIHGRSDTVKNNQDSELREQLRVGGRGISSANLYKFLKSSGYVMPRSDKVTCLVGVC